MAEHSIQVDLDDPRAKAIADVLGNKTCKKILELFATKEEVSESDVASSLDIPLNTAGYNMKKLLDAGLVEKSNKFFWSTKGKRIATYRLSNKRIIISPKRMIGIPAMIIAGLAIMGIIAVLIAIQSQERIGAGEETIKRFNSIDEIKDFIKERSEQGDGIYYGMKPSMPVEASADGVSGAAKASGALESGAGAGDFSGTNIQVEGVDEPDIVKNDGKYIYAVSGNKIFVIEAFPAENMKVVSEIEINNSNVREIFIKEDKLMVLGDMYSEKYSGCNGEVCIMLSEPDVSTVSGASLKMIAPGYNTARSFVHIYDISKRDKPELAYNITQDGDYRGARMIGEHAYIITNSYIRDSIMLPYYSVNGIEKRIEANEIYYQDIYDRDFVFTGILSVSLADGKTNKEVYLMGSSGTIYASKDNIYITGMKKVSRNEYYNRIVERVMLPILPEDKKNELKNELTGKEPVKKFREAGRFVSEYVMGISGAEKARASEAFEEGLRDISMEFARESEKTIIHKINVNEGGINYETSGEVPGRLLNQFSLDEYKGNLRMATTTSGFEKSQNHVYVLDEEMNIIGKLEGLAEGERIYSARFMGERAYMVTFRQIDPLFVIELKNPEEPKVLGYLKIPGFSDYLHPYDENYVIGIGRDTMETEDGRAIPRGMKISLFDITDVNNPREKWKSTLGDRGTSSYALQDHKAFLFSKERNLLVLPVMINEINKSRYLQDGKEMPEWAYGEPVWQGAYVFNVNTDRIEVKGKITHFGNESKSSWRFYESRFQVKRSLYMDNVLYTLSESGVKANNLDDVSEISKITLSDDRKGINPYY